MNKKVLILKHIARRKQKNNIFLLLIITIYFFSTTGFSQNLEIEDTRFINLTQKEGLSSNTAYSLLQDKKGFIWIATLEGLNRYDGYTMLSFQHSESDEKSISSNIINVVKEDKNGIIWVGTNEGLNSFNPVTETFTAFKHEEGNEKTISGNWVSDIYCDAQNNVWSIVNSGGLNLFNPADSTFSSFQLKDEKYNEVISFLAIAPDPNNPNTFWLSTENQLYQFDKTAHTFTNLNLLFPETEFSNGLWIHTLYATKNNKIWLGTDAKGLFCFDVKTKKLENFKYSQIEFKDSVTNIIQDIAPKSENELWIASGDNSLGVFNIKTKQFSFYKTDSKNAESILSNKAFNILIDNAGLTWVAMYGGVSRIDKRTQIFKHVAVEKPFETSFFVEKAIPIPNEKGFFVFLSGHSQLYEVNEKGKSAASIMLYKENGRTVRNPYVVDVLQGKDGQIWLLENEGIFVFDTLSKRFQQFSSQEINFEKVQPSRLFEDLENDLWIIGASGQYVCLFENTKKLKKFDYSLTGGNVAVRDFSQVKNDMWLATEYGIKVILSLENQSLNYMYNPDSLNLSVPATSVTALSNGIVWIGTLKGAFTFDTNQKNAKAIPAPDFLAHKKIYKIIPYDNQLWIASAEGLIHFNPNNNKYKVYSLGDGLKFQDMNYSMDIDNNGNIFIGYPFGFCYFHTDSLQKNTFQPPVILNSFKVFDKEWEDERNINSIKKIKLSYQQNFLSFSFSALSYTNSEQNQYAYKLDGLEDEWNFIGTRKYASYTNLSGGDYTFLVKAANNDGVWNENPTEIQIYIKPPFWETMWFYSLAITFFLGIFFGAYKYRIGQIRAKEKVKTEANTQIAEAKMMAFRAQMNPHFLFNCLNSINRYILKKDPMIASEYLTKFSKLMRQILNNSKHATITLENELNALKLYIQLEALRFEQKFEFEIAIDDGVDVDYLEIPPLLLQPYVENAIWHGLMHKKKEDGNGFLLIRVSMEGDYLQCIIEDNGIGREKAREFKSKSLIQNKSMGMQITAERITLMKLSNMDKNPVNIIDLKDENQIAKGTRVELWIPA